MSFIDECIKDSLPIWQKCLETDFIKKLSAGSLPEELFRDYIIDDSLYLREYSKVFAWGIINSDDMEQIRSYYSLLGFVNEAEDSTRLYYIKRYSLNDAAIQKLPLRQQNKAYVDYMLEQSKNGGAVECMMACLPCMLSYGWIFKRVIETYPSVFDGAYGKFVSDYAGESYDKLCKTWIEFTEKECKNLSEKEKKKYMEIFRKCSEHELNFWKMCENKR